MSNAYRIKAVVASAIVVLWVVGAEALCWIRLPDRTVESGLLTTVPVQVVNALKPTDRARFWVNYASKYVEVVSFTNVPGWKCTRKNVWGVIWDYNCRTTDASTKSGTFTVMKLRVRGRTPGYGTVQTSSYRADIAGCYGDQSIVTVTKPALTSTAAQP